jgi:hypothetical protein
VPQVRQDLEVLTDYKVNKELPDPREARQDHKGQLAHKVPVQLDLQVLEALQEIQVLRVDQQV